jgi:fibronectin type 3 domain-containing protein
MHGRIRTCADSVAAAPFRFLVLLAVAGTLLAGAHTDRALAVDPTVAAVGDMACDPSNPSFNGGDGTDDACRQRYVSDLVTALAPNGLLDLGDNQYVDGSMSNYQAVYDGTFGRANNVVYPALGNAEYETGGGQGFFDYFSSVGVTNRIGGSGTSTSHLFDGYYSFNLGTWHMIALNSNCSEVGGCYSGSAQEKWLKADLAANPDRCTLAYWHHPRWNSGFLGNDSSTSAFWADLYAAHADVVLGGHANHHYERFTPQTPSGVPDSAGIRQFIVSTGGESHGSEPSNPGDQNTSQITDYDSYGILRLTLHAGSYNWQFVPAAGDSFTDSGSGNCHWATATAPSAPSLAVSSAPNSVHLSWNAPSDGGSAISGYKIYRGTAAGGESLLKTLGNVTSYDDHSPVNGTKYYYRVSASNRIGESRQSNEVSAAQPPATPSLSLVPADGVMHLTWSAPTDGGASINSYKVFRGTTAGGETLLKSLANVTAYDDGSVTNGRRYYYRLAAANSIGQGASSAEVSEIPSARPAAPWLSAVAANGAVHLSWTPPTDGGSPITGYRIFRGITAGGATLLAGTESGIALDDSAVSPGIVYRYQVAAVNRMGEGQRSEEVSVALPSLAVPVPVPDVFARPVVSALRLSPATFIAQRPRVRGTRQIGSEVTYTLSSAAVTSFGIERAAPGVLRANRCVKAAARARSAKACTRFVPMRGSFDRTGIEGLNRFCFTGRVAGHALASGSYRMVAQQRAQAAAAGSIAYSRFRIVAPRGRGGKGCAAGASS